MLKVAIDVGNYTECIHCLRHECEHTLLAFEYATKTNWMWSTNLTYPNIRSCLFPHAVPRMRAVVM
jgi:hypothetical protein